jgi:hypothetical protein
MIESNITLKERINTREIIKSTNECGMIAQYKRPNLQVGVVQYLLAADALSGIEAKHLKKRRSMARSLHGGNKVENGTRGLIGRDQI